MGTEPAAFDSIADYAAAIAANPDELSFYWQLGLLYWLADDGESAQAVWLSGLMAAEAEQAALADLVQILQTAADQQLIQRPDQAEQLYQLILEMQPEAVVYGRLGEVAARQGRLEAAVEWWQQAIEHNPDWADPCRWQGQVWQRLDQYDDAAAAYQKALDLEPDAETATSLGICRIYLQQWPDAIAALQLALQIEPGSSALNDLGWVWFCLQQPELAWQAWRASLQPLARPYCAWAHEFSREPNRAMNCRINAAWLQQLIESATAEAPMQQLREMVAQRFAAAPSNQGGADTQTPCHGDTFYATTQDWNSDQCIELDPAHEVILTPPQTLDNRPHFSFGFERRIQLPGTFVAQLPQGRVWLAANQSSTAVWTADNQLLGDVSVEFPLLSPGHPDRHPGRHSALSRPLPPVQAISGRVAILAGLTDAMYFHWMLDVLPRLDLLQRSGQFNDIDWFLVSHQFPFQQQTLAALGVPTEKILAVEGEVHLQAEQLIVPSFPAVPAWMPRWACDFLRHHFLPDPPAFNSTSPQRLRLYLSRQQTATRRVINQIEIQPILDQYGFQTVELESLSVQEQASLLAQAETVLSPHGSGLTNLVFCQPGTRVIELFSPNFVYPCYWLVSNQMGLLYSYLTGTTPAGHFLQRVLYPNPRLEDLWIDPVQLAALLQQGLEPAD